MKTVLKYNVFLPLVLGSLLHLVSMQAHAKWFSSFDESLRSIRVEERLNSMTLEQKVGQLFIFGIHGKKFSTKTRSLIHKTKPGGLILFSRNIKSASQLVQLNKSLQQESLSASQLPLFIALDQEGGTVSRIKTRPALPSALSIGKTKDPTISERMGYLVGSLLRSLGVNMNLAPVLDLSDPEKRSFIGTRSFGGDPLSVSKMANAYAHGLDQAHVLATGKHFPGHGNIITDSHHALPLKNQSLTELMVSDLMPFRLFMNDINTSAIMVAHVAFPKIDRSRTPATFSKTLLNDVLRKQLKYEGLIITDDLEMSATQGAGNFRQRTLKAIEAGANLIMIAWSPKAQYEAYSSVLTALKEKRISEHTINEAVRRNLKVKMKYFSNNKKKWADLKRFRSMSKSSYFRSLNQLVLEKNFYQSLNKLPASAFVNTKKPIYIMSAVSSLAKKFRKKSKLPTRWLPIKTAKETVNTNLREKGSYLIYYVTGKFSAAKLKRLSKSALKKTLVVNADVPGLIKNREQYMGVIDIFSSNTDVAKLIAENIIRRPANLAKATNQ